MKSEFRRMMEEVGKEQATTVVKRMRDRGKTIQQIAKALGFASTRPVNRILHELGLVHVKTEITDEDFETLTARQISKKYKIHISLVHQRRRERCAIAERTGSEEALDADGEGCGTGSK